MSGSRPRERAPEQPQQKKINRRVRYAVSGGEAQPCLVFDDIDRAARGEQEKRPEDLMPGVAGDPKAKGEQGQKRERNAHVAGLFRHDCGMDQQLISHASEQNERFP